VQIVRDAEAADAGGNDASGGRQGVNQRQSRRRRRSQLSDGETSLSRRRRVSTAA